MSKRLKRINNYLLPGLLCALIGGCATPEEKERRQAASTLKLHLESEFETTGSKTQLIPIFRENPIPVRVFETPFLDQSFLTDARIVDEMGGFAIWVKFDFHGTLVLDQVTTENRGSRIGVYSMFTEGRWLAAPVIRERIADGIFVFTPDATRKEAERIVLGLNNLAVKLGNRPKMKEPPPTEAEAEEEAETPTEK